MSIPTITLNVTIAGETRPVEFLALRDGAMLISRRAMGLFQKRSGQKQWPHTLTMWRQADGSYKLGHRETILNRPGYTLRGWADGGTRFSEHNSAAPAPAAKP